MPNGETTLITRLLLFATIGATIALGKLLAGSEQITLRLALGRVILGTAVSLLAGAALIHLPEIGLLELIAIASGLGIAGHTAVELILKRYLGGHKKGNEL